MKPISSLLDRLIKPALNKYGLQQTKLFSEWELIVGKRLGEYSWPKKIIFPRNQVGDRGYSQQSNGTLYIEVQSSGLNTELYYLEGVILEKIATYFGYKAITKIKIIVNPSLVIAKSTSYKRKIERSPSQQEDLQQQINFIEDNELKSAFLHLGSQVINVK